jgi:hypothetical protein
MFKTSLLIPILNLGKFFNLPFDITQSIYLLILRNYSVQFIIDKWYSFIKIHNINLCYLANRITILKTYNFFGDIISYYDLHDYKFYITISICAKYIKPSISDKNWWQNFVQIGFNGFSYINNYNDSIIQQNMFLLNYILLRFEL